MRLILYSSKCWFRMGKVSKTFDDLVMFDHYLINDINDRSDRPRKSLAVLQEESTVKRYASFLAAMIRFLIVIHQDYPDFLPIPAEIREWIATFSNTCCRYQSIQIPEDVAANLVFEFCKLLTFHRTPLTSSRWHNSFYVWWSVWGIYGEDRFRSPEQLTHPLAAFKYILRLTVLKTTLSADEDLREASLQNSRYFL